MQCHLHYHRRQRPAITVARVSSSTTPPTSPLRMKENHSHHDKNGNKKRWSKLPLFVVMTASISCFMMMGWRYGNSEQQQQQQHQQLESRMVVLNDGTIQEGVTGGIPYLHCGSPIIQSSSSTSSSSTTQTKTTTTTTKELILLHGAQFTKEDWKTSGILQKLCRHHNDNDMPTSPSSRISVTALDLDRDAGYIELKQVLDHMKQDSLLIQRQQEASSEVTIVTPSASGKTIVDWLENGNFQDMKDEYGISKWIPVAPPIVGRAKGLDRFRKTISILAIYGNQDKVGKVVSTMLQEQSDAKVQEIPGRHPCYLDSPDQFVKLVLDFIMEA